MIRAIGARGEPGASGEVWAIGDCAAVPDAYRQGQPCPPTAQHAIRQGRLVARNVAATLGAAGVRPFRYRTKGVVAELGHNKAVAITLGMRWRGFPAWFIARTYHLLLMPGLGRQAAPARGLERRAGVRPRRLRPGTPGQPDSAGASSDRFAATRRGSADAPGRLSPSEPAYYPDLRMAILEQIKADLKGAMRAGEKERVGALRLVLSELQKAAKEGSDDELAVLRRERKRRLEAARAYREAGTGGPRRRRGGRGGADQRLPARGALRRGAQGDRRAGGARQRGGVGEGHGQGR